MPFFTISGSDFVEMFVGVGASRVRDMFEQAKKNAPCIIFIDEIDAVGRHRGAGLGGGNDEREQTLNQLLVEMDGFEANEGVILIAATNRPDVLDPALLRPGRFDRQVVVPNPDIVGPREDPQGPYAQCAAGARRRPEGHRPRHARLLGRRPGQPRQRGGAARRAPASGMVTQHDFEDAKDKVMMGAERRSMAMSDEEKKLTAYHEAGHALVGLHVPGTTRCTRRRSSRAAGRWAWSCSLPERDRFLHEESRDEGRSRHGVRRPGRRGADLRPGQCHHRRRQRHQAGDATGPRHGHGLRHVATSSAASAYGDNQEEVFLGHSVAHSQNISEETARLIDAECRRLVDAGEAKAREVLNTRIDDLHAVAAALLEYETLTNDEVQKVLNREPIERKDSDDRQTPTASSVPVTKRPTRGPEGHRRYGAAAAGVRRRE